MAAIEYDILIEEGATFSRILTLRNNDNGVFSPIDLTGHTVAAKIKKTFLSTAPVIATFDASLHNATAGQLKIELSATVTAALLADAGHVGDGTTYAVEPLGFYDVEITHTASGFVTRLLRGKVTFSDEITT